MAELTHSSTHPPLPPTTEEDRLSWLRLLRSRRVGIATFWRLISDHGHAGAALAALPAIAAAAGVSDYAPCPEPVVLAEYKAARAAGARMICAGDRAYPAPLLDIPDPPPILWLRGDAALLVRPMVALVGARNASSLGERMARGLAADLSAAGYVVVSGLARGVDAAAHAGALSGGTIAVMAGGVDVIYPSENTKLAQDIQGMGLLISEQPMGLIPQARHFPTRNRIISGLSRCVVVVEAAARSGSLITARTALDQGREVMAVPGHPMDARATGCNMLIRDGALLIRDAADVIEAIGRVEGADWRPRPDTAPQRDAIRADQARSAPVGPHVADRLPAVGTPPAGPATASASKASETATARRDSPAAGTSRTDGTPPAGPATASASKADETATAQRDSPATGASRTVGRPPAGSATASASNADETATARRDSPAAARSPAPRHHVGPPQIPTAVPLPERPLRETATLHAAILDRLGPSPLAEDQLIRDLAASAHSIAPALLDLEMEGRIQRQPGGLLSLVN